VNAPSEVTGVVADRSALLGALAEPTTNSELAAALDVSRSTVSRRLRELEAAELVRRGPEGYARTRFGDAALAEYRSYAASVGDLLDARRVLLALPRSLDIAREFFVGAEVNEPTTAAPYEPLSRCVADLRASDRVLLAANVAVARYADQFSDGLLDPGVPARAAVPTPAMRRLVADRPAWFTTALSAEGVSLRELPEDLPVSVAVLSLGGGERATLTAFDADGVRGYVTNDSPAAVAWARKFVESLWAEATPVGTPES
jgi:predicted transcriptional regulator